VLHKERLRVLISIVYVVVSVIILLPTTRDRT